jgi:hypothetical protein
MPNTFEQIELKPIKTLKKLNLFQLLITVFLCELEF